ncbi:MAG: 50S ribosomal protein L4 [Candidatus Aenigmatarchaeota archaeon]
MMKANVYDAAGKPVEKMDMPAVFSTPLRRDLITRAFLSIMSRGRQAYGTDLLAGNRSSAHYHGRRRRERWTMMGKEMARMQRIHGKQPGYLQFRARNVPQAVKGREAHPPKTWKDWTQRINKKENRFAIDSALAATTNKALVEARGHSLQDVKELPIVLENAVEKMSKAAELAKMFAALGLSAEIERVSEKRIRAGRGKSRGRKYRVKVGPLIVVSKDSGIGRAANSFPGVAVSRADRLNVAELAPGALPGRLTLFTKGAIAALASEKNAGDKKEKE